MARARENKERNHLTRGMILSLLQAQANRQRSDEEGVATYADEALIWSMVSRRYRQGREQLRANLYYLRDRECVKFKEVSVAGEKSLMWRITAKGTDLLEGNVADDPGVEIE